MIAKIGKFSNGWAWFIIEDNEIVDQGFSEDEDQARADLKASVFIHSTHTFE